MKKLLSRKEIAEALGVSTRTIDRMIKDNQIPRLMINGTWKFDLEEVVEDCTVMKRVRKEIECPHCKRRFFL